MRIRLLNFWNELLESNWLIPSVMIVAAMALAALLTSIDLRARVPGVQIPYLWRGSPEGARGLLEVIAGTSVTVASLIFSITMVVYAQAASQFGPRLLRNFTRDRGNQVVLGTFVSTFVYCLIVLWSLRSRSEAGAGQPAEPGFTPYLAVSAAFGMALAGLVVLIYYIHHVSQSIYAPKVIASVANDLMHAIESLFPREEEPHKAPAEADACADFPDTFDQRSVEIKAHSSGYLQGVDYAELMEIAMRRDLRLSVSYRPGQFIIHGDDLGRVWPAEQADERLQRELERAFVIGSQRLAPQDVEYAVDQLVEVAVRALSPAVNDPFTALNCIDWLGVALSRLSEKKIPPPYYCDVAGESRIRLMHPITFEGVVNAAFDQIRQQAGTQVAVHIHLLEVIAIIQEHTADEKELAALHRQGEMIVNVSRKTLIEPQDIRDIEDRFARLR